MDKEPEESTPMMLSDTMMSSSDRTTLALALATRYAVLLRRRVLVPKKVSENVAEAVDVVDLWKKLCPGFGHIDVAADALSKPKA